MVYGRGMSNHIAAKFVGIVYSQLPRELFKENLPRLVERLRTKLPRFDTPNVNDITVNVNGDSVAAQTTEQGKELHLVDAQGNFGVKIGNQGLSISCDKYVDYEELLNFFTWVIEEVSKTINISHFSRLTLRNINLFKEIPGQINKFEDIRDASYWGRQEFATLNNTFACSGAATRHEYLANDYLKHININSGVVMPSHNQSYIPQDEWNIWKLRGAIPTLKEVSLLIDISATKFVSPVNQPELQNNVIEFNVEIVKTKLNELHELVNNVYFDITKDD